MAYDDYEKQFWYINQADGVNENTELILSKESRFIEKFTYFICFNNNCALIVAILDCEILESWSHRYERIQTTPINEFAIFRSIPTADMPA